MFNFSTEAWQMIGKYGLATVFASVLLGFVLTNYNSQTKQLNALQETNKNVAVSNNALADALDDQTTVLKDVAKQTDDVGDSVRIMTETAKAMHDANRRVLEKIWKEQKEIAEASP